MPRPKRWTYEPVKDGVWGLRLASWKYLHDYIRQEFLEYPRYIWRGQRRNDWPLLPSFDRLFSSTTPARLSQLVALHLDRFKFAARGRRGPNPPRIDNENDWWAIGQHNGLATPLLDWTTSPYVALFFAFYDQGPDQTSHRAIYGLTFGSVQNRSKEIATKHQGDERPPIVEFVRPMSDENSRLVSQGGLFTRNPTGIALETWVRANFAGVKEAILIKIDIPDTGRRECLQALNRMNISHLSLFPDLYGASKFCNLAATLPRYASV